MIRTSIALTVALAALLIATDPVAAQTPSPVPFQGFTGIGSLALRAQVNGLPIEEDASIAVMSAAHRVRLDLLTLTAAAGAPQGSDIASHFLQVPITLVYDQGSNTMTLWSAKKRVYYQTKLHGKYTVKSPSKPAPESGPKPKFAPIDQVLHAMKSLTEYDTFNQTLALVGHQPINGHTASLFHFVTQSQKHGGKPQTVTGDLALADDLSGIPLRFWVTIAGTADAGVKLDLLSASLTPPAASAFAIPAGYQKVSSPMQVLGAAMPARKAR
ncbi:MAG: hypothetical protein M3Y21_00405 [Candidatus Eremiobacteraeota bacterium]|nr:hypothetical protein [Candidatus Eremiobacteraeota bacterium]